MNKVILILAYGIIASATKNAKMEERGVFVDYTYREADSKKSAILEKVCLFEKKCAIIALDHLGRL